jgi:hypothetical protein
MSQYPRVGETLPAMTSRGRQESVPPKAPTRAVSLEDKGIRGSRWVTERQKFRTPKVCFLLRKPSRFVVRIQEWQDTKKSPIYIHIPDIRW